MNFDTFFDEVERKKFNLEFDNAYEKKTVLLSNEALFHLPFLATIILMLAKGRRKPKSSEIGQLVGECLERSLAGFKGSSQHLGWSANLRIRTVKAMTFLETAGLIQIDQQKSTLKATDFGRKVINSAIDDESDISIALRTIDRSFRNIQVERQIEMELE